MCRLIWVRSFISEQRFRGWLASHAHARPASCPSHGWSSCPAGPAGRPCVPAIPFVSLSEQPHQQCGQQTLPLAALSPPCLQAGTWLSPSLTPDVWNLLPAPDPLRAVPLHFCIIPKPQGSQPWLWLCCLLADCKFGAAQASCTTLYHLARRCPLPFS